MLFLITNMPFTENSGISARCFPERDICDNKLFGRLQFVRVNKSIQLQKWITARTSGVNLIGSVITRYVSSPRYACAELHHIGIHLFCRNNIVDDCCSSGWFNTGVHDLRLYPGTYSNRTGLPCVDISVCLHTLFFRRVHPRFFLQVTLLGAICVRLKFQYF